MIESERELQDYFLELLENNSFNFIKIPNEDYLISNFKKQFELFNNTSLSNKEFLNIYNFLINEPSFDKLRNGFETFSFIDFDDFKNNNFQVTEEVTVKSQYTNRFDVSILINGIPIIQVELKKPGVDLKEAFNQIKRYDAHTYKGLYSYIHLFVISNNVHTRFFFNNHDFDYHNSFNWYDNLHLDEFTNSFLTIDNLSEFFRDYIFLNPIDNEYYMLRPYQIEAINKVKNNIDSNDNAYLWMTYGSGLTLTSLRLAYILSREYKVVYVAFNNLTSYPKRYLAKNKNQFLKFFKRKNLIISHIKNILPVIDDICDENVIYIFNDYEEYYMRYNPLNLKNKCSNSLFYLFSHAPIFNDNIVLDKTSKYIFDNHIFSYNMNNLYLDKLSSDINIEIYGIFEDLTYFDISSPVRINANCEVIKNNVNSPSILITSSNEDLIKYYYFFKNTSIKIAPIFRFDTNDNILNKPVQDIFKEIIENYNQDFDANIHFKYRVNDLELKEKFERNIIKKFNNDEIDLLLIDASMFTNPFYVNIIGNLKITQSNLIFMDCNLKYESLLQVLSLGNITSFRDIRDDINQTIKLFANDSPKENYQFKDYNHYLSEYAHYLSKLKDSKGDFIDDYKKLAENHLILESFDEYDFDEAKINEFNSFKDQYEHKIYEFNASKKEITQYDIELLYKFTIDIDFIKSIKEGRIPKITQVNEYSSKKEFFTISDDISDVTAEEEITEIVETPKENIEIDSKKEEPLKDFEVPPKNEERIIQEAKEIIEYESQKPIKNNFIHTEKLSGDIIPSKEDFINSIDSKDSDGKICPNCGKKFEKDANFCDSCEELIKLVNLSDLVKECPCCGFKYPDDYNFCVKCHCPDKLEEIKPQINIYDIEVYPNEYYNSLDHTNRYGSIHDLLNENNRLKLEEFTINYADYEFILSKIKSTYQKILSEIIETYSIDINMLSTYDKILLLAKSFVKVKYKHGGGDSGNFAYNEINIDDRQKPYLKITAIIHELSHFILAEIFEQALMLVLDTDKTDAIEAFVCEILLKKFNYLVDEYCAHTVEGRYAVFGYQNYGSFISQLNDYPNDEELTPDYARIFGNTFARDIIDIIGSFINEKMRKEIHNEFNLINEPPNYEPLKYETREYLDNENISRAMNIMINYGINHCNVDNLEAYVLKFKINNSKG